MVSNVGVHSEEISKTCFFFKFDQIGIRGSPYQIVLIVNSDSAKLSIKDKG